MVPLRREPPLLGDAGLRASMGAKGRERARHQFSWKQVAKQALGYYEDARPESRSRVSA